MGWLEKLFDVQEGSGFEGIGEKIKTLLEPIGDSIKDFFSSLWVDIYNGLPGVLQGMFVDPNKSEVVSNGDGTYTVTSSNNNTAQITPKTKELGQWLIDNKDYITVDSGGQLRFTKGLGQMYTYDEKTGTFSQYDANWLLNDLQKGRTTSDRWFAPEVDILTELNKVIEQYGQPKVEPTLDVSSLVQQASSLTLTGAKVIADLVVKGTNDAGSGTAGIEGGGNGGGGGYVAMNPMADKGGSFAPKAWGGRIGRRMDGVTVGEDGTEYIIPITKPERAASLIQQMFGELGPSVMERITSGMGLGQPGTNGFSLSSLQGAIGGMTANSNTTINAPMNFYINSSGADAKEIGSSIYDSAERHLIRNVMGVYA